MSSGKTRFMNGQKVQALIRRRAFCVASEKSLNFLYEHLKKAFFLAFFKILKQPLNININKYADLTRHWLFLHKPAFLYYVTYVQNGYR